MKRSFQHRCTLAFVCLLVPLYAQAIGFLGPIQGRIDPGPGHDGSPLVVELRCRAHGLHGSHQADNEVRVTRAGEKFLFPWMYRGLAPTSCSLYVYHPLYVSWHQAIEEGFTDIGVIRLQRFAAFLDAGPSDPPMHSAYAWPLLELNGHLRNLRYHYLPQFRDLQFLHAHIPALRTFIRRAFATGAFGYTQMYHRDSPVEALRDIEDRSAYPGALSLVLRAANENDPVAMRRALEAGAWADGWQPNGDSALYICVRENSLEALEVLLAHGADPEFRSRKGSLSPLQQALFENHWQIAARLLQAGAGWRGEKTRPGWVAAALYNAAHAGDVTRLRVFLDHGMPVDAAPSNRVTPLMGAAKNGQLETAKLLIARGADVNARGSHNRYALRFARASKNQHLVELLIRSGATDPE